MDENNNPTVPTTEPDEPIDTPAPIPPSPMNPPDDVSGVPGNQLDDTHPATDTDIQPEEVHDEGLAGAAEAAGSNPDDSVPGPNPETTLPEDPDI